MSELRLLAGEYVAFRDLLDQCEQQPKIVLIAERGYQQGDEQLPVMPMEMVRELPVNPAGQDGGESQTSSLSDTQPEPQSADSSADESAGDTPVGDTSGDEMSGDDTDDSLGGPPSVDGEEENAGNEDSLATGVDDADDQEDDAAMQSDEGRSAWWAILWTVGGLLVVLAIGAGGLLFLASRRQSV